MILRRALWGEGLRYRLHVDLPGRPDLAFLGPKVVVFVDGCFWHGCPRHYIRPKTRSAFWQRKLRGNVERDARQTLELEEGGWSVLRVWEHEVAKELALTVERIATIVRGEGTDPPPTRDWRVIQVQQVDPHEGTERRRLRDLRDPSHVREVVGPRVTNSGH